MKKIYSFLILVLLLCVTTHAQTPITARNIATYNAAFKTDLPDSVKKKMPYFGDLGVRRVIVADANNDGQQEIIATDYTNGGRVHVIAPAKDNTLEVIWSSPVTTGSGGSTPRYPQVGDCDGDGNPEIIFEQKATGQVVFYEWDPLLQSWGTEPAFAITSSMYKSAGSLEEIKFDREVLTVYDFDGDKRSEIVLHGLKPGSTTTGWRDVYILGIDGEFPGIGATLKIEGGHPATTQNARNWAGGSFWNVIPADIDGDGKIEIVNHHWDKFAFWSIDVNGPDNYTYPDTNKTKVGIYATYDKDDGVSYMGASAVDVDGDGISEIVGTEYVSGGFTHNFDLAILSFTKDDTGVNIWKTDSASVAKRYGVLYTKEDLAALGGKTTGEYWPSVKGDLNKDGKDEIYTGGSRGTNLIAIQYKGTGSKTDSKNYIANVVYKGEGGDVFATYKIYNGKLDTLINGSDTTITVTDPTKIDTVKEETPFTAYIFADKVDLNNNGRREIVISEQSVYDSISVKVYNWDSNKSQWINDTTKAHKIYNPYRKTIRVLEYDGTSGVQDQNYTLVFPSDYKLEQNFPNPFNPSTTIRFSLPIDKKISLKIYDMLGKEVATLVNDQMYKKGKYEMQWNGKTSSGQNVASGNYIARLVYGNYSQTIKMTLLK